MLKEVVAPRGSAEPKGSTRQGDSLPFSLKAAFLPYSDSAAPVKFPLT